MIISLYEMTNDLSELLAIEEISEEQKQEIADNIMEMIKGKSENIIKLTRNMESRIKSVKEEEKRLAEYRKSEEKKLERLKNYVVSCLQDADIKKIDTNVGRISLKKSPASVQILDEDKIPQEFKTIEQVTKISKKDIKEILKAGKTVEGAVLVDDNYSITIK